MPSTSTGMIIGMLRRFFAAMISRATTAASATGKARSAAIAIHAGSHCEMRQAIRPRSQSPASRRVASRSQADAASSSEWLSAETRDSRHDEAEQHFVDVPGERIEPARQRHAGVNM